MNFPIINGWGQIYLSFDQNLHNLDFLIIFMDRRSRVEKGKTGAYIGIVGNLLLFAVKLPLGIVGNSYALIAAAFHTLSDALSSLVVLVGFHVVSKPADEKHHLGHGDAEALTGLVVSILIVLIGFEVGKNSYVRIIQNTIQEPGAIAIAGAAISIVGNWVMAGMESKIGREIRSPSLMADSAHHASDALSSIVVLAGILLSRAGYPILDPVAGLFVALFIMKTGFDVGRENIDMLMGMVPNPKLVEEIKNLALGVKGVEGVHSIKIHYVGAMADVRMHIEVAGDMKVIDGDRVSHKVQARIVSELDDVMSALVHVCPARGGHNAGNRD
jgi:cation diffusion facilitator family transporter